MLLLKSCFFRSLEATYTRQLLVMKGWLLGEAGGHLINNTITNILNFIYQWLGNCWCWRGNYLRSLRTPYIILTFIYHWLGNSWSWRGGYWRSLEVTLQITQITNILNFIYQWLGNCWCWRSDYPWRVEVTLQYSNLHLSLTGQQLVVKGWLLVEAGGHFTIFELIYCWLGNC